MCCVARQAGRNPNHTYYSVKRFIGKDFDDCREDRKRVRSVGAHILGFSFNRTSLNPKGEGRPLVGTEVREVDDMHITTGQPQAATDP